MAISLWISLTIRGLTGWLLKVAHVKTVWATPTILASLLAIPSKFHLTTKREFMVQISLKGMSTKTRSALTKIVALVLKISTSSLLSIRKKT